MFSLECSLTQDRIDAAFYLAKTDLTKALDAFRNLPEPFSMAEYTALHAKAVAHRDLCRARYDALLPLWSGR